jgi:hypothetical protein
MRPPKLTTEQLQKLHELEPKLRIAAVRGDYESAQQYTIEIQRVLRPTGHEARLMQAKAWLFEAAMEAGQLNVAEPGFIGIRKKMSRGSRLHLEATTLLAICYLRQKKLEKAEPLITEALRSRNIRSESGRRRFLRHVVARFEEEGLLAALIERHAEGLDAEEIQNLAAELVRTKSEDEIFADIGRSLPPESVAFLLKVDAMSKRGLSQKEVLYLPGEAQILEKAELGRTTFRSAKRVLWNSLCNPESDIYKAWFSSGLNCVLDRKYLGTAIAACLLNIGIGIKALAVSFAALVMKFGIEVYCDRFKPDFILETRGSH